MPSVDLHSFRTLFVVATPTQAPQSVTPRITRARGINWTALDSTVSAATSRPRSTPAGPNCRRAQRPVDLLPMKQANKYGLMKSTGYGFHRGRVGSELPDLGVSLEFSHRNYYYIVFTDVLRFFPSEIIAIPRLKGKIARVIAYKLFVRYEKQINFIYTSLLIHIYFKTCKR